MHALMVLLAGYGRRPLIFDPANASTMPVYNQLPARY